MKLSIITLIILIFLTEIRTQAQDIHFTNFLAAPQILNPANTGNDNGRFRIQTNRRQQGSQIVNPYITTTLSFDMPVYYYSEKASFGFIYINDKSADRTLIANQIYLTSGYFRKVSAHSYLHAGFQAGYVMKRYSLNGLTFPDRFDMSVGYFSTSMPTAENLNLAKSDYFDLNWGLMWSLKKQRNNAEIGISMFHYNRPDQSFFDNNDRLPARYTFHAFYTKAFAENRYIKPKYLSNFQNGAHEILAGFDLGSKMSGEIKDVRIGLGWRGGLKRISDAVEFNVGTIYRNFNVSMAFDFDVSNKKTKTMSRNAIELTITYKCPDASVRSRTTPCEIY